MRIQLKSFTGALWVVSLTVAGCELALGLGDKTFCDDRPEGCQDTTPAATGTGASGGAGGAGGNGATGGTPACATYTFEDEFDTGALALWDTVDDLDDDITDPMGTLYIEPDDDDYWWYNERAPFVYREVCGNFGFWVQLDAKDPSTGLAPSVDANGGGILVRNPDPRGPMEQDEHWLSLFHAYTSGALGAQGAWSPPTDGGFVLTGIIYEEIILGSQLALCRIGDNWHGYVMRDCDDNVETVFEVPTSMIALPDVVQLGVTVQKGTGSQRIEGAFRWAVLFRPNTPADCEAILDPTWVPEYACP
jgi:hypothetical protein